MPAAPRPRRRRSAEEARRDILDAAEKRLRAGGPDAVRVQLVARDLGLTDAAVHHHFGSRDGLMTALIRRAGRRMRAEITAAAERWDAERFDIGELAELIARTFADQGFARLSAWLLLHGYQPAGSGLFRDVAEAIHAVRVGRARQRGVRPPPLDDTLFTVALLTNAVWADPIAGASMRRSVSLPADRATAERYRRWLGRLLQVHLERIEGVENVDEL